MDTLVELVPNAKHITWERHLYTNFKAQPNNKGKALKDCLWKIARATYLKEYEDEVSEMRSYLRLHTNG